jgi:hypothetical protein
MKSMSRDDESSARPSCCSYSYCATGFAKRWIEMPDDKTYTEKSTSTTETKTNAFGVPEKDAAGENVKETTTTTEGTKEDESGKDD